MPLIFFWLAPVDVLYQISCSRAHRTTFSHGTHIGRVVFFLEVTFNSGVASYAYLRKLSYVLSPEKRRKTSTKIDHLALQWPQLALGVCILTWPKLEPVLCSALHLAWGVWHPSKGSLTSWALPTAPKPSLCVRCGSTLDVAPTNWCSCEWWGRDFCSVLPVT